MRLGRSLPARTAGTTTVGLVAAALALLLVGCGSSDDGNAAPAPPSSPSSPSTPSATGSAPTGPATPTAAPSDTPSPRGHVAELLTAAELPRLSAAASWTQGPTGPADPEPAAACHDADLVSIGARNVIARTYTADAAEAVEQIAVFPDAATTARAGRVLASFRDDCVSRVKDLRHLKVGPARPVGVVGGTGWWYLASWLPAGTAGGHFQSVGVVVGQRTIAVLVMDHEGQDHDYPPNSDPMIAAVKAAAAKMSGPA
jgi:hypothetical protein